MTDYATVKVYACTPDGFERDEWPVSFRTTWMHDYDTGPEVEARWHRVYITKPLRCRSRNRAVKLAREWIKTDECQAQIAAVLQRIS